MGQKTKSFLQQIIIGLILAVSTAMITGFTVSQQIQAVNIEKISQNTKDIDELKDCSEKKADKTMIDYAITELDKRLTRIENKIDKIKR